MVTDLARALEVSRPADLSDRVALDQKGGVSVPTPGGRQSLKVISESGFYKVVFRSDKPQAQPLIEIVTREVLPQLRRTGRYVNPEAKAPSPIASENKDKVESILLIHEWITKVPGVKPGIAAAATLASIESSTTGINIDPIKRALPVLEGAISSCNATALGRKIGKSAKEVNKMLSNCGLQLRNDRGDWEPTDKGARWGESMPYVNGATGHSGYQTLWNPDVVDVLQGLLDA